MAIAFVQGTPTGGISGTYNTANAAGNLLVCSVVCWDGATYPATNSVSDSRNGAWTRAVQSGDAANIGTVEIWYRENCGAGTNTVTLTTNVGAFTIFNIAEFSGVATSGSLDKTAGRLQSNLTAPSTGAVTTTGADLAVACVSCSQDDLSPGSGFSLAVTNDGNPFEYQIQTAAGSIDGTFVSPGNNGFYGMSMATFSPPSAGGGGQTLTLTGIASAEAFGTVTKSSAVSLAQTGIASTETFGALSQSAAATLALAGIASSEALGALTKTSTVSLTQTGIGTAEAFGAPTVSQAGTLVLTGIASAEAFGTLTQSADVPLAQTGIPTAEAFGAVTLSQAGTGVDAPSLLLLGCG